MPEYQGWDEHLVFFVHFNRDPLTVVHYTNLIVLSGIEVVSREKILVKNTS